MIRITLDYFDKDYFLQDNNLLYQYFSGTVTTILFKLFQIIDILQDLSNIGNNRNITQPKHIAILFQKYDLEVDLKNVDPKVL